LSRIFKTAAVLFLTVLISCAAVDSTRVSTSAETDSRETVVLLHGLGRGKSAMRLLASRLEDAGFLTKIIKYKSLNASPKEILETVTEQINTFCRDKKQTIHFAGHSLGGLLVRAYLDSNKVENLGRVVLIGTPNKGTPLVDKFQDSWLLKLMGETTLSLGTDENSFPNSIGPPYYPAGIIAGSSTIINNEKILPGDDDGVVPVESAKLDGMTDMIVINAGHSMLRYNKDAADAAIHFLKHGRFKH